jgi:hypothetical protein
MPDDSSTVDDKPKPFLGLSGTQTLGSALAAVTSAVVGSFLGVAGTLIGAALGSIVATIAGALYARTLDSATVVAKRKLERSRQNGGRLVPTEEPLEDSPLSVATAVASEKDKGRKLPPKTWIRIGAISAAAFAVAIIGITALEFGTSKPISSLVTASTTSSGEDAVKTTIGAALTGGQQDTDEAAEPGEGDQEAPAVVEEGSGVEEAPADPAAPGTVEDGAPATDPGAGTVAPDSTVPAETGDGSGVGPAPAPEPGMDGTSGLDAPTGPGPVEDSAGEGGTVP